jgi:hypothetical protein
VWAPSPDIGLTLTNLCSLLGVKAISFRFRPVGTGAAFQVDDVYLDPGKASSVRRRLDAGPAETGTVVIASRPQAG